MALACVARVVGQAPNGTRRAWCKRCAGVFGAPLHGAGRRLDRADAQPARVPHGHHLCAAKHGLAESMDDAWAWSLWPAHVVYQAWPIARGGALVASGWCALSVA